MKVRHLIDYTAAFYPNWNHDLVARLTKEWDIPRDDRIGPLSVGQLQKVAILLALGHEPELLILDEPAASLDPLARRQFLQMIIDLAEPGKRTVLFSTHITSDLERVADRVAILKSGRIAWQGLIEDLKEQTHVSLEDSFLEMHNRLMNGNNDLNRRKQRKRSSARTQFLPSVLSVSSCSIGVPYVQQSLRPSRLNLHPPAVFIVVPSARIGILRLRVYRVCPCRSRWGT